MRYGISDTELLLEVVGEAYGFHSLEEFRPGVLDLLTRVAPSDYVSYNEISPDEIFVLEQPTIDPMLLAEFAAYAHEHPLISYMGRTRDGRPCRISDVISRDAFHQLEIYKRFFGALRCDHQVALTLPSAPPRIIGVALTRSKHNFSEREVALLGVMRPHLMRAYRNAELHGARAAVLAALEHGLDVVGRHVLVLDTHRRVEFATHGARLLLGASERNFSLPPALRLWLEGRPQELTTRPLILRRTKGNVIVRMLPSSGNDGRRVLLLEGAPGELTTEALWALGLTHREAETLHMIALDHTPAETAAHMGVSRRTVDKHLQHAYAKLGVTTLAQATSAAWAAVGIATPTATQTRSTQHHPNH
jgi:DNA-binding CsgD family transcriptional regulator